MTEPIIMLDQSKQLSAEHHACIDILSQALDEAKKGNIDTLGLVVRIDGQFVNNAAGMHAGGLQASLFNLMVKVNAAIDGMDPTKGASERKSKIIRPGRA